MINLSFAVNELCPHKITGTCHELYFYDKVYGAQVEKSIKKKIHLSFWPIHNHLIFYIQVFIININYKPFIRGGKNMILYF